MVLSVWIKASLTWFVILLFAILNGALREITLIPVVGSFGGFIASGLILSICIFLIALLAAPWYGRLTFSQWLLLGLFWFLLTGVFEFGIGRLVQHNTWRELFEAYTFKGGNIWPVVLVTTLISPWVAARLRGLIWVCTVQEEHDAKKRF